MSRSSKKGFYVDERLFNKALKAKNEGSGKIIKTWSRACVVAPEFVGLTFGVHNGKDFVPVFCTENMVGHRLGEFSITRKFRGHGGQLARATGNAK